MWNKEDIPTPTSYSNSIVWRSCIYIQRWNYVLCVSKPGISLYNIYSNLPHVVFAIAVRRSSSNSLMFSALSVYSFYLNNWMPFWPIIILPISLKIVFKKRLAVWRRCFECIQVKYFHLFSIKETLFDIDHQIVRSIYRCMSSLPTYETLKLSQPKSHVTLVELNRPTKLNAMNKQLFE